MHGQVHGVLPYFAVLMSATLLDLYSQVSVAPFSRGVPHAATCGSCSTAIFFGSVKLLGWANQRRKEGEDVVLGCCRADVEGRPWQGRTHVALVEMRMLDLEMMCMIVNGVGCELANSD